jgi:hypothetical protein
MPKSYKSKFRWILTAVDHCTLWPVAVPLKDTTAAALAEAIFDHIIIPFGAPRELLTNRGSNYLSSGFRRFLEAAGMKHLTTSGYHPQTNGKSERLNGILEAAIFCLNTSGDPSKWEDVLPAALFSVRIHVSDSSGFSPFELLYGVKPRLPKDRRRLIAAEPVIPGAAELAARLQKLNLTCVSAAQSSADRASRNKERFDGTTKFARDLESLVVGQAVKLRNEQHTKGAPRWYGPFEISQVLDNNVYKLVDHEGAEYPRPVNGNSIRPVSLQSLLVNDMWATPPAIAQREKHAETRVAKALLQKTKQVTRAKRPPASKQKGEAVSIPSTGSGVPPPGRRLWLWLGPPPTGSGTDPS